jgi:hypothetical protein
MDIEIAERWIATGADEEGLKRAGFKPDGGGVHQAKTMMLAELTVLLHASPTELSTAKIQSLAVDDNLFGKRSLSTRRITSDRLRSLYGLGDTCAVTEGLLLAWKLAEDRRGAAAILCALARDPVLRRSAGAILEASPGSAVTYHDVAPALDTAYAGRWSEKMLRSASQNCASSWTQAGFLNGRVRKVRRRPPANVAVAAYAALLARLAGFSGDALITSRWFDLLDCGREERMELLRRAAAQGWTRVRTVAHVVDVELAGPYAEILDEFERQVPGE